MCQQLTHFKTARFQRDIEKRNRSFKDNEKLKEKTADGKNLRKSFAYFVI